MGKKTASQGETLTADGFKKLIPELTDTQINHLFNAAKARMHSLITVGNKNLLPESLATILIHIHELHEGIRMLRTSPETAAIQQKPLADDHGVANMNHGTVHSNDVTHGEQPTHKCGAPIKKPIWVEQGLAVMLQKRQNTMQQMSMKLSGFEEVMKKRGMVYE